MTLLRKPLSIVLIGSYYLLSPVLNLVQLAWVSGLPLTGFVSIWSALSPVDWAVLLAFPLVGWGMLTVRRWGWLAFIGFSLFLIVYNSAAFVLNRTYDLALVVVYNFGLVAVTFVFFRKHLRAPYFNPRLQWWNADPRYPVVLKAEVVSAEGPCAAEILDLSRSGLFLSSCGDIEVGQVRRVNILIFGRVIACAGKVMRKSSPSDPRPGFGIMFEHQDPDERVQIRWLIGRLVRDGARERGSSEQSPRAGDPLSRHLAWHLKRLGRELLGI